MRFKKRLKAEVGLKQIEITPLIDCVFLLIVFFMLTSSFVVMPGINIKLPKTVTQETVKASTLTVTISSEDVIYVDDKAMTKKELKGYLKKNKNNSVFIKADKDASLGAMVKVWDICKELGIDKIGMATTFTKDDELKK